MANETAEVASGAVPDAPPSTTPGAAGTPPPASPDASRTGAAPTGFSYQEDRSRWIPPHRLSEETTRRQALEAQIAERDRKIQALAGVTPPNSEEEKKAAISKAFFEMFPHLSEEKMRKRDIAVSRQEQAEQREWQRHADRQMAVAHTQVAEALGAESLSDDQKSDLQDSFANWLKTTCAKELQLTNGTESATLTKYEKGDASVVGDFVKRYTANWVEPARRRVTAQNINRSRAVPDSTGRSQVTSIKKPAEFKTLDDRLDYAAGLFKERGGQFSDR
jgi:hypothetical protein